MTCVKIELLKLNFNEVTTMDHINLNTESRIQKHLISEERFFIEKSLNAGQSIAAIARVLGRSRTTIHAEIKRGTILQCINGSWKTIYSHSAGQQRYEQSRKGSFSRLKVELVEKFLAYCEERLFQDGWSLDVCFGYALANGLFRRSEMVCPKTLYNYVHEGILNIKAIDLPVALKRNTKHLKDRKHKRLLGRSIDERDDAVNQRLEFGHWEIDTVRGSKDKSDNVIVSLLERMTRLYVVLRCPSAKAEDIYNTLNHWLHSLSKHIDVTFICKSITADNGTEFSDLPILDSDNLQIFYAHPYSSWERGSNERHNGLFRRFVPKGTPIKDISDETLKRAMEWSNKLPRKILQYKTPIEAFLDEVKPLIDFSESVQFRLAI